MTVDAEKLTLVLAHIVVAVFAVIVIDGVNKGLTVMVTVLLVAVVGVTQVALLVKTAVITSLLFKVVVV